MTVFTATLSGSDGATAVARFARTGSKIGAVPTGNVKVISERHLLWEVEFEFDGDVNDAWVVLTSYGISPAGLGSAWEQVAGVGA